MKNLWTWLLEDNRLIVTVEGVIIIILSLLWQCDGGQKCTEPTSDTTTVTVTLYDSFPVITPVPRPYPVRDTIILPPEPIDSLAVCMAYFTMSEYNVILRDDSDCYAQYNVSVYMNHLLGGDFIFKNRRPTYITNTTIIDNTAPPRKWHFYAGLTVGGSLTSFDLAPGVMVQYKRFMTGCSYSIMGKSVNVPIYYELFVKRKKK